MAVLRQNERRSFYRAPDGRPALLHCGRGKKAWLDLLEVSAWGFTLASDEPLPLEKNTLYQLRTSAGWSEVQLIHCHEDAHGRLQYGLGRLRDLRDLRAEQRTLDAGRVKQLRHDLPKERIANVGYFIALAFAYAVYLYYAWN